MTSERKAVPNWVLISFLGPAVSVGFLLRLELYVETCFLEGFHRLFEPTPLVLRHFERTVQLSLLAGLLGLLVAVLLRTMRMPKGS